jgi:hypothetical protein
MVRNRPALTVFAIISDVDDLREVLNDVRVSAAGTRLPLTLPFREVRHVIPTQQQIPGEAEAVIEIVDRQPYGPLVQAKRRSDGVAIEKTIDFEVIGY